MLSPYVWHVILVVSNSNSFVLTFSVFHWISSPCGKRLNLLTGWKHIHVNFTHRRKLTVGLALLTFVKRRETVGLRRCTVQNFAKIFNIFKMTQLLYLLTLQCGSLIVQIWFTKLVTHSLHNNNVTCIHNSKCFAPSWYRGLKQHHLLHRKFDDV